MTSTSPYPEPNAFEIRFRDDATEPDRLNAERSVAALIDSSRSSEAPDPASRNGFSECRHRGAGNDDLPGKVKV